MADFVRAIPQTAVVHRIRALNPQWSYGRMDPPLGGLRRRHAFRLFFPLVRNFQIRRALVLYGPRRMGKTTMLMQAIQELLDQRHPAAKIVYFRLDDPLLHGMPLDTLLRLYSAAAPGTPAPHETVVLFDEIQYLNDWSAHLKSLVDAYPRTRFIASASARPALRLRRRTPATDDFTEFHLLPLTFYEFLDLQGALEATTTTSPAGVPIPKDVPRLNEHFVDYLNYGGYPETATDPSIREYPERYLRSDVVDRVLLHDLPSLHGVRDIRELTRLFGLLAYRTGSEVTYEELNAATGIAKNTLRRYLEYLEAAFLVRTVRRIDQAARSFRRANFFKVYLTTPSLYTALFGQVSLNDHIPALVETAIYSQFLHHSESVDNIHYVRWKKGGSEGEVDFVQWDESFRPFLCIDVRWGDPSLESVRNWKGLLTFARAHRPESIFVTTRATHGKRRLKGGGEIQLVPASIIALGTGFSTVIAQGFRGYLGGQEQKPRA